MNAANINRGNATELSMETEDERGRRLYAAQGGPLIAWLFDEARRRGEDLNVMARNLGVTYGYINQLRVGMRCTAHISQDVSDACAAYLGVPTIVVKVVSGSIKVRDFMSPVLSEEQSVNKAISRMLDDPQIRLMIPVDLMALSAEAKKALVLLYAEKVDEDIFRVGDLPEMVRKLKACVDAREVRLAEVLVEVPSGSEDLS
ncbi:hypothetical protein LNV09_14635 [Paucibacter sp. B2R-40]|uniref:hypothetical protein n=1 Tax=Paucibacter sp. B2R-40 TaxID=2893554 RepID=UPI0021E4C5FF|nr:hypothetical protein [Paucibacter sp. B2R-40]MCV2355388.1 hypothetical protein [Paucibacter sp. B2R-40]